MNTVLPKFAIQRRRSKLSLIYLLPLVMLFAFLVYNIVVIARQRPDYSHFRHSISELGESNSTYELSVSYGVFLPFGLGCLLLSYPLFNDNTIAASLLVATGLSYALSAFFPCDPGTPFAGSWKNTLHNIIGAACYAGIAHQLNELTDISHEWYASVPLIVLCTFLSMFVIGWPKQWIGLAQRLAEGLVFVSILSLLFDKAVS